MSMFLGPIHYLMFNKIKIAADRSRHLVEAFAAKYPSETEETVKAALPDGLPDLEGKDLAEILGDNPIHQFLQSLIDKVETAEAGLTMAFLYRFPDDGREITLEAFRSHGAKTAEQVTGGQAGNGDLNTLYNLLSQHYLEGMPCDVVSSYNPNGNNMEVLHTDCVHKPKWESAGAPVELMCELMDAWVEGFARAVNPAFTLERKSAISKGADACSCNIKLV